MQHDLYLYNVFLAQDTRELDLGNIRLERPTFTGYSIVPPEVTLDRERSLLLWRYGSDQKLIPGGGAGMLAQFLDLL